MKYHRLVFALIMIALMGNVGYAANVITGLTLHGVVQKITPETGDDSVTVRDDSVWIVIDDVTRISIIAGDHGGARLQGGINKTIEIDYDSIFVDADTNTATPIILFGGYGGALRWNRATDKMQFSNNLTDWSDIGTSAGISEADYNGFVQDGAELKNKIDSTAVHIPVSDSADGGAARAEISKESDSTVVWVNLVNDDRDSVLAFSPIVSEAKDSLTSWANEINAATDSLASWANEVNAVTDSLTAWANLVNDDRDSVLAFTSIVSEAKDSLTSWANEVNAATDSLTSWANEVNEHTDSIAAWANLVNDDRDSVLAFTSIVSEAKDSLTSWANEVNAATDSLASWANEVNEHTDSIAAWANLVNDDRDSVLAFTSIVSEAKDSLTSWANEVNAATDSLASWANEVNAATDSLASWADEVNTNTDHAADNTQAHTDYLINTGDAGTGVYDFGGATSFELPAVDDPATTAEGHIAWDANDDAIEVYMGDETESALIPAYQKIDVLIFAPDGVNDKIPIFRADALLYPFGVEIDQISITIPSDAEYSMVFEEWAADPPAEENIISTVTTGASDSYAEEAPDNDAALDADDYIFLDIPATDVDWIHCQVIFHVVAGN